MQTEVLEAVRDPDLVRKGYRGALMAIRHYARTPVSSKFLVVVYRETDPDDGFVVTAYLSNRLPEETTT